MDDLIFFTFFCFQFFKGDYVGFIIRNIIFKSLIESEPQLFFDLSFQCPLPRNTDPLLPLDPFGPQFLYLERALCLLPQIWKE